LGHYQAEGAVWYKCLVKLWCCPFSCQLVWEIGIQKLATLPQTWPLNCSWVKKSCFQMEVQ